MAGKASHGDARAVMSPMGKDKRWERFSVEHILNTQIKLSVNSRLNPV